MLHWDDPLSFIHGLTTPQRKLLQSLEVETVGGLLSIFPRRYDDYSKLTSIAQIVTGETVTIRAEVVQIKQMPTFRKRFAIIRGIIRDQSGSIGVTWFNQPWLLKQLKTGDEIFISGAVTERPRFGRGFTSPIWEPATQETLAAGLVAPVYPLVGSLTQKTVRKVMKAAVADVEIPPDSIPVAFRERARVISWPEAIRAVHIPSSLREAEEGRRRIAFGELLSYQLALRSARIEADTAGAPMILFDEAFAKIFVEQLPFELTIDQKKAVWACVQDMQVARPMRRLLQGDVGSGKTIVAAMLSSLVFRQGASAVCMAPTDLLAKQHAVTFERFLVPHGISVLLWTSSSRHLMEGGEVRALTVAEARERVSRGRIVVVGTHALLERGQTPPDVALVVVDEQHRFGVGQREALVVSSRDDGKVPHLLSMSATPIPRSLALTLLGDLDVSIISTKPQGRLPVVTKVLVGEGERDVAYQAIRDEVAQGHRAFVVCPLIDPSDTLGVKSVEAEARRLATYPLRGLHVDMMHGKMSARDKDEAMLRFSKGESDVLVATTVVEVGVDVPEATIILIEGAERFGLAQLHQLRGRVGRSNYPSRCFLIASDDGGAPERLRVLERTADGFEVAEADLRLRGSGNILGTQQSGTPLFRAARMDDVQLMTFARESATELLRDDPRLDKNPALAQIITTMRQTSHRE